MTTYSIIITFLAQRDLIDIWTYVAKNDGIKRADALIEILEEKCESLSQYPERGHTLQKLENHEIFGLREVYYKSYKSLMKLLTRKL